jgi:hypothetical protein
VGPGEGALSVLAAVCRSHFRSHPRRVVEPYTQLWRPQPGCWCWHRLYAERPTSAEEGGDGCAAENRGWILLAGPGPGGNLAGAAGRTHGGSPG